MSNTFKPDGTLLALDGSALTGVSGGGGGSPVERLNFVQTADIGPAATSGTPTDVIADIPNFASAGGLITIYVRGEASWGGVTESAVYVKIDGTLYQLAGSANGNVDHTNFSATVEIPALAANAAHTVTIQAATSASTGFYCRPTSQAPYEFFNIQIVEGGAAPNPMTQIGQMIVGGAAGAETAIGPGANGQVPTVTQVVDSYAVTSTGTQGVGSCTDVGLPSGNAPWTMGGYIKGTGVNYAICALGDSLIYVNGSVGIWLFAATGGLNNQIAAGVYNDGVERLLAVSYNGTTAEATVDGVAVGTLSCSPAVALQGAGGFTVGDKPGGGNSLTGTVSRPFICGTALTPADLGSLVALKGAGQAAFDAALLAFSPLHYYEMGEASGDFADSGSLATTLTHGAAGLTYRQPGPITISSVAFAPPPIRNTRVVGNGGGSVSLGAVATILSASVAAVAGDEIEATFVAPVYLPVLGSVQTNFNPGTATGDMPNLGYAGASAATTILETITITDIITAVSGDLSGGSLTILARAAGTSGASVLNSAVYDATGALPILTLKNLGQ